MRADRSAGALALLLAVAALAGCGDDDTVEGEAPKAPERITLESPAFEDGAEIPKRFTCDGDEAPPPLSWSGVPAKARELALLVEDRDADRFVHWSVLAIPAGTTALDQGRVPGGAVQTENGFGKRRWGGPCPPEGKGEHRYVFALYALDGRLGLGADASADDVRVKVGDASVARGVLTGRYGR
jgi:Raf kinase inhibitor-like YbhB/YbcL family protein